MDPELNELSSDSSDMEEFVVYPSLKQDLNSGIGSIIRSLKEKKRIQIGAVWTETESFNKITKGEIDCLNDCNKGQTIVDKDIFIKSENQDQDINYFEEIDLKKEIKLFDNHNDTFTMEKDGNLNKTASNKMIYFTNDGFSGGISPDLKTTRCADNNYTYIFNDNCHCGLASLKSNQDDFLKNASENNVSINFDDCAQNISGKQNQSVQQKLQKKLLVETVPVGNTSSPDKLDDVFSLKYKERLKRNDKLHLNYLANFKSNLKNGNLEISYSSDKLQPLKNYKQVKCEIQRKSNDCVVEKNSRFSSYRKFQDISTNKLNDFKSEHNFQNLDQLYNQPDHRNSFKSNNRRQCIHHNMKKFLTPGSSGLLMPGSKKMLNTFATKIHKDANHITGHLAVKKRSNQLNYTTKDCLKNATSLNNTVLETAGFSNNFVGRIQQIRENPWNSSLIICIICSFQTTIFRDWYYHFKNDHESVPPVCPFCGYQGQNQYSYMKLHVLTVHLGQKPYKCLYCSFSTGWKNYLKTHMFKHKYKFLT